MRTRRSLLIVLPAVVLAAAAGFLSRRDPSPASVAVTASPATTTVAKRTLTRTQRVSGRLGHGNPVPVAATGPGMVTWLPAAGAVIGRGGTVYRVDQRRIPLLYGAIPIYRTLSAGRRGDDVRQLEGNLHALGYSGFTVDDRYTAATAGAVRNWQRDLGRDRTGAVQPGDAVVAAGPRRVAAPIGLPGTPAAGILLKWTGTTRTVAVDLNADYADLARPGAAATVELPDGTRLAARVTAVGAPAATQPVELTVTEPGRLGGYQAARVDVDLTAETHRDVLAVPVTALVARPGGGYAVQSGATYLPVRTGLFADGYVEVSGVAAGLTVAVPR